MDSESDYVPPVYYEGPKEGYMRKTGTKMEQWTNTEYTVRDYFSAEGPGASETAELKKLAAQMGFDPADPANLPDVPYFKWVEVRRIGEWDKDK
jgi:hypothetical protein